MFIWQLLGAATLIIYIHIHRMTNCAATYKNLITAYSTPEAMVVEDELTVLPDGAGLLRPHLTVIRSPCMSRPLAQACAASSAEERSLKLINAHLRSVAWLVLQKINWLDSDSPCLGNMDYRFQLRRV